MKALRLKDRFLDLIYLAMGVLLFLVVLTDGRFW